MDTLRLSLASTFALVLSSLTLGGCTADSEVPDLTDNEEVGVSTQGLTATNTIAARDLLFVLPECRAVLVSTGPAVRPFQNAWGCPSANPYVGQKRYAGELEAGITELRDIAQPGQLRCTTSPSTGTICKRTTDRLVEQLCTETLTYECPCGVENVTVDGVLAGQCKRVR